MKLYGQQKRVYELLKSYPHGINSNQLRNFTHIVDIPKTISELNKKGIKILSERKSNGTADYKLAEIKPRPIRYEFVGNDCIAIYS